MTAMEILVILLSIFLAVFLLIGIVLAVLLIRITQQIKKVTSTAEKTVNGLEGIVNNISKYSTPSMIIKAVTEQIRKKRR